MSKSSHVAKGPKLLAQKNLREPSMVEEADEADDQDLDQTLNMAIEELLSHLIDESQRKTQELLSMLKHHTSK